MTGMPNSRRAQSRNIILTGPPRSGTTLACHLFNKVPNVVALHEPVQLHEMFGLNDESIAAYLDGWFAQTRHGIRQTGSAPSKVENGKVPDNPFGGLGHDGKRRIDRVHRGRLDIGKPLTDDFLLAIKHPAAFTALLPLLVKHWSCFAVIRNPLGTVMSWNSLEQLDMGRGRLPMAETFDAGFRETLVTISSVLDRQLYMVDWCFERYATLLPPQQIIRYESIIESGGAALGIIDPAAAVLCEPLSSKNANSLYNPAIASELAVRMIARGGAWEAFYSAKDIAVTASQIVAATS